MFIQINVYKISCYEEMLRSKPDLITFSDNNFLKRFKGGVTSLMVIVHISGSHDHTVM